MDLHRGYGLRRAYLSGESADAARTLLTRFMAFNEAEIHDELGDIRTELSKIHQMTKDYRTGKKILIALFHTGGNHDVEKISEFLSKVSALPNVHVLSFFNENFDVAIERAPLQDLVVVQGQYKIEHFQAISHLPADLLGLGELGI